MTSDRSSDSMTDIAWSTWTVRSIPETSRSGSSSPGSSTGWTEWPSPRRPPATADHTRALIHVPGISRKLALMASGRFAFGRQELSVGFGHLHDLAAAKEGGYADVPVSGVECMQCHRFRRHVQGPASQRGLLARAAHLDLVRRDPQPVAGRLQDRLLAYPHPEEFRGLVAFGEPAEGCLLRGRQRGPG